MIPLSFWILVSAAVAFAAYFDNKLTLSGALLAFVVSSIHFAADPRFGVLLLYFLYHAFEPTEREAADRNRIANFRGLPWGWNQVLSNSVIATVLVVTGWSLTGWEYNCVYSSQSGVIKAFVGGIIGHYCCCLEHTTTPKMQINSSSREEIFLLECHENSSRSPNSHAGCKRHISATHAVLMVYCTSGILMLEEKSSNEKLASALS